MRRTTAIASLPVAAWCPARTGKNPVIGDLQNPRLVAIPNQPPCMTPGLQLALNPVGRIASRTQQPVMPGYKHHDLRRPFDGAEPIEILEDVVVGSLGDAQRQILPTPNRDHCGRQPRRRALPKHQDVQDASSGSAPSVCKRIILPAL